MAIAGTAIWRVRPGGNNANGGGYDPGISGAGTDYSQQDAPQASGTAGTASGATAFSDAAGVFTAAMVGNAIQIASGSGFTAGFYFITGYTSATAVTLDRSPGTGSAAVWKLGGGWADFWTNAATAIGGNFVYILGTGIPDPSKYGSPDYIVPSGAQVTTGGSVSTGRVTYATDPATSGYASGGMALIKQASNTGGIWDGVQCVSISRLYLFFGTGTGGGYLFNGATNSGSCGIDRCVMDQNGVSFGAGFVGGSVRAFGCEFFNSGGGSNSNSCFYIPGDYYVEFRQCNFHNLTGYLLNLWGNTFGVIDGCIFAKNENGPSIYLDVNSYDGFTISNNTFDGNTSTAISIGNQMTLNVTSIFNNIFSNHVTAGAYPIAVGAGTAVVNQSVALLCDYNTYYNNANAPSGIAYGPHDTLLATDPYAGSSTQDYTLA